MCSSCSHLLCVLPTLSLVFYPQTLGFEFEFGTQYSNAPRQRKSAELVRSVVVSRELSPSPPKVFRSLSDGGTVFPVSRHLYAAGYGKWPRQHTRPGSTRTPLENFISFFLVCIYYHASGTLQHTTTASCALLLLLVQNTVFMRFQLYLTFSSWKLKNFSRKCITEIY